MTHYNSASSAHFKSTIVRAAFWSIACCLAAFASVPAAAQQAGPEPTIKLSPAIPHEVEHGWSTGNPQLPFDVFSWNSFIALNWPPGPDGEGDPNKKIGASGDNRTVWEEWIDAPDIFLPGGKPPKWTAHSNIPDACKKSYEPGMVILRQVGKTPDLLELSIQPFDTGPLIDQNGAYARFQVNVNRSAFDYILANALYSKAGQQSFSGPVSFPCGQGEQQGTITAKAAWKVLGAHDNKEHFHKTHALIYTAASVNPPVKESCRKETVGLVGFHIGHKVNHAPQWVWSTFEQVDNVPTEQDVKNNKLKAHYSYYNPQCKSCPVNIPAPRPWIPNRPGPPTQVVRMDVFPQDTAESALEQNRKAQQLLRGVSAKSVWQYYQLVSTQWPSTAGDCNAIAPDFGNPAPQFLANTTLETYIQGTVPNTSSSCISCHRRATLTTGGAPGSGADFIFLLQSAK